MSAHVHEQVPPLRFAPVGMTELLVRMRLAGVIHRGSKSMAFVTARSPG